MIVQQITGFDGSLHHPVFIVNLKHADTRIKIQFQEPAVGIIKTLCKRISDEQLLEIKWLPGKYFAEKADAEMDRFIEEKGLT